MSKVSLLPTQLLAIFRLCRVGFCQVRVMLTYQKGFFIRAPDELLNALNPTQEFYIQYISLVWPLFALGAMLGIYGSFRRHLPSLAIFTGVWILETISKLLGRYCLQSNLDLELISVLILMLLGCVVLPSQCLGLSKERKTMTV